MIGSLYSSSRKNGICSYKPTPKVNDWLFVVAALKGFTRGNKKKSISISIAVGTIDVNVFYQGTIMMCIVGVVVYFKILVFFFNKTK